MRPPVVDDGGERGEDVERARTAARSRWTRRERGLDRRDQQVHPGDGDDEEPDDEAGRDRGGEPRGYGGQRRGQHPLAGHPETILAVITIPAPVLAMADSATDSAITLPQPPPPRACAM